MTFNGAEQGENNFVPTCQGMPLSWVHRIGDTSVDEIPIEGMSPQAFQDALSDTRLAQRLQALGIVQSDEE
ncbi:MAG: hypothetical protein ACI9X4_001827 [Glaciecola sp.]